MYSNIYGFNVFSETLEKLVQLIDKYDKVHIVSGNPEILSAALKNKKLYDNFHSKNSVIIPDGIGTVICSKIVKQPVKEKIAGIETMEAILLKCEKENKSVYLLGAQDEIIEKCVKNIKLKYPRLIVAGYHNGYFDVNDCSALNDDINKGKPYAIFVGMGCPRQEMFVIDNMNLLSCKVFMSVGGSFDVFAGKVNRAPRWMIKLGLEWLYRLIKEPYRIKRIGVIPVFILKVLIRQLFGKRKVS